MFIVQNAYLGYIITFNNKCHTFPYIYITLLCKIEDKVITNFMRYTSFVYHTHTHINLFFEISHFDWMCWFSYLLRVNDIHWFFLLTFWYLFLYHPQSVEYKAQRHVYGLNLFRNIYLKGKVTIRPYLPYKYFSTPSLDIILYSPEDDIKREILKINKEIN